MTSSRTKLYRDNKNGKVFGVCAGIAEYTGINPFWLRIGLVVATFAVSGINILAYIAAALLMEKKPDHLYADEAEAAYWQGVRQNPKRATREVRAKMRDIDRRLASVENYYVSNNSSLSAEIERLR